VYKNNREEQSRKWYSGADEEFIKRDRDADKLYGEIFGSLEDESERGYLPNEVQKAEIKKNRLVNRDLEAEIKNKIKQNDDNKNKDTQISSSELSDNNWEDLLRYAKSEEEINDIKNRVLNDIESKRNIKKGKRKRDNDEEEENDSPTEQPDSKKVREIKNKTLG